MPEIVSQSSTRGLAQKRGTQIGPIKDFSVLDNVSRPPARACLATPRSSPSCGCRSS